MFGFYRQLSWRRQKRLENVNDEYASTAENFFRRRLRSPEPEEDKVREYIAKTRIFLSPTAKPSPGFEEMNGGRGGKEGFGSMGGKLGKYASMDSLSDLSFDKEGNALERTRLSKIGDSREDDLLKRINREPNYSPPKARQFSPVVLKSEIKDEQFSKSPGFSSTQSPSTTTLPNQFLTSQTTNYIPTNQTTNHFPSSQTTNHLQTQTTNHQTAINTDQTTNYIKTDQTTNNLHMNQNSNYLLNSQTTNLLQSSQSKNYIQTGQYRSDIQPNQTQNPILSNHNTNNFHTAPSSNNLLTNQTTNHLQSSQSKNYIQTGQSPSDIQPIQTQNPILSNQNTDNFHTVPSSNNLLTSQTTNHLQSSQSKNYIQTGQSPSDIQPIQTLKPILSNQHTNNFYTAPSSNNLPTSQTTKHLQSSQSKNYIQTGQSPSDIQPIQTLNPILSNQTSNTFPTVQATILQTSKTQNYLQTNNPQTDNLHTSQSTNQLQSAQTQNYLKTCQPSSIQTQTANQCNSQPVISNSIHSIENHGISTEIPSKNSKVDHNQNQPVSSCCTTQPFYRVFMSTSSLNSQSHSVNEERTPAVTPASTESDKIYSSNSMNFTTTNPEAVMTSLITSNSHTRSVNGDNIVFTDTTTSTTVTTDHHQTVYPSTSINNNYSGSSFSVVSSFSTLNSTPISIGDTKESTKPSSLGSKSETSQSFAYPASNIENSGAEQAEEPSFLTMSKDDYIAKSIAAIRARWAANDSQFFKSTFKTDTPLSAPTSEPKVAPPRELPAATTFSSSHAPTAATPSPYVPPSNDPPVKTRSPNRVDKPEALRPKSWAVDQDFQETFMSWTWSKVVDPEVLMRHQSSARDVGGEKLVGAGFSESANISFTEEAKSEPPVYYFTANSTATSTASRNQNLSNASSEGGKGRRITNLRQPQSPPTTTTRDRDRRSESSKSPAPSEDAPFSGTRSPVHGTGPAPAESTILRPGSAAGSRPSTATPLSDQARSPEPPPVSPPQTEWDDIEPGARHPPIPNPPQTGASSSTKKDDRPYPTPGSFIPAHYCTFLYCMSETSATRHLKKGEYVGLPVAFPHEISTKSFENHRKFVYATIIDIINLKEFRPDASNLLRLNIGANRKTKTAEFKDVYRICNEDPAKEIVEEEEAEKNKSASHDEAEPKMGQEDENGSDTYRSPSESSYSNSASGTGTSSRAEREDPKSPEEERKARKDLEEKARKKLEEERLRRKQAKEAEWRAKYGFDKEDPLLKKKQQKEERKKTFWERCSGMNGSFPEESSEDATVDEDIFDIEEMKEKISEALDDAWEKPEAIRKKIVKRLLLEWHPDKNPDKSEEAKILFQHLQKELKRCEEGIPRIKLSKWRDFMFGKRKPGGRGATRAQSFRTAAEEEKQEGSSSPRQSPFMKRKEFAAGSRSFDSQAQPQTSKSDSPPFQPKEPQNSFKDRYNSRFKDSFGLNSTANDNGARANENESATHDSKGRRFSNISQTFDASEEPDDELGNGNFSSHESRDTFYKSYIDRMRETRARARGQSPGREPSAEPSPEPSADKPNNWRGNFDRDRESQKSWRNGSTQGAECRRWHGQAQRDLKSASHDFDAADASYEWVCYKCHHSAEKALKAVVIAQNLPMPDSHDLNVIAAKTQNAQLIRLSNQMTVLLGDHERMVYPNAFHSPKIPADAYTQGIATMALSIAKSIINCSDLIVLRFR